MKITIAFSTLLLLLNMSTTLQAKRMTYKKVSSVIQQQLFCCGYTGQEKEFELTNKKEMYNYRARMYSPQLGKFLSPDKAKQQYGAYTFCGNNPVSIVDRDGNILEWAPGLEGIQTQYEERLTKIGSPLFIASYERLQKSSIVYTIKKGAKNRGTSLEGFVTLNLKLFAFRTDHSGPFYATPIETIIAHELLHLSRLDELVGGNDLVRQKLIVEYILSSVPQQIIEEASKRPLDVAKISQLTQGLTNWKKKKQRLENFYPNYSAVQAPLKEYLYLNDRFNEADVANDITNKYMTNREEKAVVFAIQKWFEPYYQKQGYGHQVPKVHNFFYDNSFYFDGALNEDNIEDISTIAPREEGQLIYLNKVSSISQITKLTNGDADLHISNGQTLRIKQAYTKKDLLQLKQQQQQPEISLEQIRYIEQVQLKRQQFEREREQLYQRKIANLDKKNKCCCTIF